MMPNPIRARRKSLGLSVAKVADKAGISSRMGWAIEAGQSVGLKYFKAYILALGGRIEVRFPGEGGDNET